MDDEARKGAKTFIDTSWLGWRTVSYDRAVVYLQSIKFPAFAAIVGFVDSKG
jgi:hypothetical protein